MNYYYLKDNILTLAKNYVVIGNKLITNPTDEQYKLADCYPKSDEPIPEVEGKVIHRLGWEVKNDLWVERYEYVDPPNLTSGDVDSISEQYLYKTRFDRGYTSREPDAYLTSTNQRWSQDAKDWVLFRDLVVEYSINIINSLDSNPITESEFRSGLPKIKWTIE